MSYHSLLQHYSNLGLDETSVTVGCIFRITIIPLSWDLLAEASPLFGGREGGGGGKKKKHFHGYNSQKPQPKFNWSAIQFPSPLLACLLNIPSHPIDRGELFSMVNKYSGKVICSAYNLGDPLASSALSRQRMQWLTQPYPPLSVPTNNPLFVHP